MALTLPLSLPLLVSTMLGLCAVAVLLLLSRLAWRGEREHRLEKERMEAYRRLYVQLDVRRHLAHFSYRPATGELVLDARVAQLHGLRLPEPDIYGDVRLTGWHQLPAAARAAGWIDEALADGLSRSEPICCEYLARLSGQPDRHFVMTAMPAKLGGLVVGVLAEREHA